jgi:hypothetical protein
MFSFQDLKDRRSVWMSWKENKLMNVDSMVIKNGFYVIDHARLEFREDDRDGLGARKHMDAIEGTSKPRLRLQNS